MNRRFQNLHTHTSYCDGQLTAEEMVKAAIEKGGGSIGFSEHSYVSFEDTKYAMAPAEIPQYISEVKKLKTKYAGQIEVFLGMEQDYFTDGVPEGLDYIIGAVHHVQYAGEYITIDNSYEGLQRIKDEHFGGDVYAMVECYFETVAGLFEKNGADIIGHFDLISKQNDGGRLYDETNPRYIKAALTAMDTLLDGCRLFEINTGAMYRKGNTMQYPSTYLLRELAGRGGEIVLSSDSHDAASLYYGFEEMIELAKHCGFKFIKRLASDGFIDEKL